MYSNGTKTEKAGKKNGTQIKTIRGDMLVLQCQLERELIRYVRRYLCQPQVTIITNDKRPAAPTANRDPRKLVAVMLDSAPINIESVSELPYPDMGAFYKNEDQTLYVKRDIGDSVALCQCVAQELGHAELSMNSEVYSRRDMGFQAVCIGYMLCKKYGVDTQNFAIDRIPDELKNKEPKDIKAELGKTQKAFKEITARVSDELYRQRAERSKEQER